MHTRKAIKSLREKFNVIEVINLNDNNLYQRLQKIYKEEYNPNDRIVIVQDQSDSYDYTDLPGKSIIQLQKFLRQIDISNWFVIVVSGNPNIANELLKIRNLYANNDDVISHIKIDLNFKPAVINKKDTFCPLPWMHVYIGPDGNVLPCCVADHQYPMGNIEQDSIDTIANSEKFTKLKDNMLNGIRSKECASCYQKEDAGLPSSRQEQLKRWKVVSFDQFKPVYLDIRLNNICNLKCRMCSSYFSSAIAQEEIEIYGRTAAINGTLINRQRKLALKEIIKFLPTVEKIYFAGGEPLLAPEHYEILEELVNCNNTDVELFYNTNFTRLQFRDISVLDVWKKFSNVTIGASLDADGDVAEYVRCGTVWKDVESNIKKLQHECPHVKFTVTSTAGLLNVESLISFQKSSHLSGQIDISKFSLSVMTEPDHLTVAVLPEEHKKRIGALIDEHIKWCHLHGAESLAAQWTNVLNYMKDNDSSHYLPEFKRIMTTMDSHRNQSFKEVFPLYHDLI